MTKEIEIDLNDSVKVITNVSLDEWEKEELIEELKSRELETQDILSAFNQGDLTENLVNRIDFKFSDHCELIHYSQERIEESEQILGLSSGVTTEPQIEILERFSKCHNLLNWQQWNHIFCKIEKMTKEERASQPEKFDYL